MAKKYQRRGLEMLNLIQEGNLGHAYLRYHHFRYPDPVRYPVHYPLYEPD